MNRRLAIVTFHRAYNYGAVLQAYALNRFLRKNGVDCDLLDYYPSYFYNKYNILPSKKTFLSDLKTMACHILLQDILAKRNKGFELFLKQYVTLSDPFHPNMNNTDLPYDAYIVGSDQVWSPSEAQFDPVFFLSTISFSGKKKYSYAASLGSNNIKEELQDIYKKRLSDYRMISVREEGSLSLINRLARIRPTVSCDPTLLLDRKEWDSICGDYPIIEGDYIFLYYVKQPKIIREYAQRLAYEKNIKVVCLSCVFVSNNRIQYYYLGGKADCECGFISYNTASPNEFLNLIKYAKYVLTSSYHGTVFSILFHKQFLSQTKWSDGKENERVVNLLDKIGLSERTISEDILNIERRENWEQVDYRIAIMQYEGAKYLSAVIDDINAINA